MRKLIVGAVFGASVLFAGTACEVPQACESLGAPSEKDKQAVADGYEVEREDDAGNECELQRDGSWEEDV